MILRDVSHEDFVWVWECRNDETTRKNSISSKIISLEEHLQWMEESILLSERKMMIAVEEHERIGIIRFDVEDRDTAVISINIAPKSRGRGYSQHMLEHLEVLIKSNYKDIRTLKANIKKENLISIKTFTKSGFSLYEEVQEIIILTKSLYSS
ncbi:GNAT family N-acetyltransferase [Gorillibacterium massiliense]|uniref:GNAT family N-acetyltransferase n=1 Tax=Gorillibacterium massiliense TaxID=1280390 RepID=UPI0005944405|nr:GNAT family N-acetyltransferase [Gorillibacterium massiliense]